MNDQGINGKKRLAEPPAGPSPGRSAINALASRSKNNVFHIPDEFIHLKAMIQRLPDHQPDDLGPGVLLLGRLHNRSDQSAKKILQRRIRTRTNPLDRIVMVLHVPDHPPAEHLLVKRFFTAEMVVDRCDIASGLGRDIPHRRTVISLIAKQLLSRIQKTLTRVLIYFLFDTRYSAYTIQSNI